MSHYQSGNQTTRTVILVDFYWTRDKDPRIPLGHASLLTTLRETAGVQPLSLVYAVNAGELRAQDVVTDILRHAEGRSDAEVDVALSAYVWGEEILQATLRELRARGFRGRVILGGPQISYASEALETLYPTVTAFVRGYGEEALAALAVTSARIHLPGVHWAGEHDSCETARVQLESLPSPWLSGAIPIRRGAFLRWETQRGCPYRCTFCQHREPGARMQRRRLNLTRIEAEIDLFCERGVADIAVLDPIFNLTADAEAVLRRFASNGFTGRLSLQCRPELLKPSFLDAAANLNVRLEFGLQTVHEEEQKHIQRRNQIDVVDRTLADVRVRGIDHEVSLIFGLPAQTLASFIESVAWCLERRVPVIKAFPLMLLRGTDLERRKAEWGLENGPGPMPCVERSNSFSRADWLAMERISNALKHSEQAHPDRIADLLALAEVETPSPERWAPARSNHLPNLGPEQLDAHAGAA